MPDGISRETFEKYDVDGKLNTIFDYQIAHNKRLESLEKKVTFRPAMTGFLGGMTIGVFIYLKSLFFK